MSLLLILVGLRCGSVDGRNGIGKARLLVLQPHTTAARHRIDTEKR